MRGISSLVEELLVTYTITPFQAPYFLQIFYMLATMVRHGPLDFNAIRKEMQFLYHGSEFTVLICGTVNGRL